MKHDETDYLDPTYLNRQAVDASPLVHVDANALLSVVDRFLRYLNEHRPPNWKLGAVVNDPELLLQHDYISAFWGEVITSIYKACEEQPVVASKIRDATN